MTISSADRRAADLVGHIVRMPDGRWIGVLTDRTGGVSLVLQGAVEERAGTERLDLIATAGPSDDVKRLRREAKA